MNNRYRQNLGVWLGTWTEISEQGLEEKNTSKLQKFQYQASKMKQIITMAYDYTSIIATYHFSRRITLQLQKSIFQNER